MMKHSTYLKSSLFCLMLALAYQGKAQDTTPPVIDLNTPDTVKAEINSVYTSTDPTVTDNQSDVSSIKLYLAHNFNGPVNTTKRGWYTDAYTAIDSNGNQSQKTRYIIVGDFMAPVITLNTRDTVYHKIFTPYNAVQPSVTDNYSSPGQLSLVKLSTNVNPNVAGTYYEVYEAIDSDGNKSQKTRVVIVGDKGESSIAEISGSALRFSPNPAASSFNLLIPEGISGHLSILSVDGKTVMDINNVQANIMIDISHLQNGAYMLVFTGSEYRSAARLLISH